MKKITRKIDYYQTHPFESGVLYQLPNLSVLCVAREPDHLVFEYFPEQQIMSAGTIRVKASPNSNLQSEILPIPKTNGVIILTHGDSFEVAFAGPKVTEN